MILRKPYALFIKLFKPIHLIISILIAYLLYSTTKILSFLNNYIYSNTSVVGTNIKNALISNLNLIIPIVVIGLSLLMLGVMFRKKKPITFYIVCFLSFVVVIIITLYASNFLSVMEKSIVSIKSVKLIHDLVLINVILETFLFIIFVVRGMGVNFKKFDFSSEIAKFDISESDKEEFELDINVDLSESKRKRKRSLRYLKYAYLENKFLINCIALIILGFSGLGIYTMLNIHNKINKEGMIYSANTFNFGVNNSTILNTDYKGQKLTNDNLIIVNVRLKSNFVSNSLYLNDFKLEIGEATFRVTTKYANSLVDLGISYDESVLPLEYTNYLFVYEIPEKYIKSEMLFSYNDQGKSISIKLKPKNLSTHKSFETKNIKEELNFEKTLGDIKFKINNYEIEDRFTFKYNYCIKEDDCISSIEYMRPTLNTSFDKFILKLNVEYTNNSDLDTSTFYKFFSKFGSIYYIINDEEYHQNSNFEELKSKKTGQENNVYIGVDSKIVNATSIKIVFKIRESIYEYVLK